MWSTNVLSYLPLFNCLFRYCLRVALSLWGHTLHRWCTKISRIQTNILSLFITLKVMLERTWLSSLNRDKFIKKVYRFENLRGHNWPLRKQLLKPTSWQRNLVKQSGSYYGGYNFEERWNWGERNGKLTGVSKWSEQSRNKDY